MDYGRISLPRPAYDLYTKYIESLGMPWIEGCRNKGETFRERCLSSKKSYINHGSFVKNFDSLESKAMAFMAERKNFIGRHKVCMQTNPNIANSSYCDGKC